MNKMRILIALCLVFVLTVPCVVSAEDSESSLVTYEDGLSYPGLPDYPPISYKAGEGIYYKIQNYVLCRNTDEDKYYLYVFFEGGSKVYHDGVGLKVDYIREYNDAELTDVDGDWQNVTCCIFTASLNDVAWTEYDSVYIADSGTDINRRADTFIQCSDTIYSDREYSSVFMESATRPSISGLSSTTLKTIVMMEMVGLVPLVIGFLICLMGLWKGYRVLRQVLSTV